MEVSALPYLGLPRSRKSNWNSWVHFFFVWGKLLLPKLVPGAHVVVASNPLVSYIVSTALADSGLERRGEIVRLTMTMRGGDRPKAAHEEFSEVSVMPRSMWSLGLCTENLLMVVSRTIEKVENSWVSPPICRPHTAG